MPFPLVLSPRKKRRDISRSKVKSTKGRTEKYSFSHWDNIDKEGGSKIGSDGFQFVTYTITEGKGQREKRIRTSGKYRGERAGTTYLRAKRVSAIPREEKDLQFQVTEGNCLSNGKHSFHRLRSSDYLRQSKIANFIANPPNTDDARKSYRTQRHLTRRHSS